jgi:hypothetical protein
VEDNIETIDRLTVQFGSLRARRNMLLSQRQIISVLDTELTSIELRLSFLSRMVYSTDFEEQQTKIQQDMEKTAKTWFAG